jgi:4-hydroxy 2-oxovalerate aldolase
MKNVKILDCTLRDGGRVIDCAFPDLHIKQIAGRLANARIDLVEVGFLRDKNSVEYRGNSTFFTDVHQISPFLDKSKKCMYTAFIDYGMFDFHTLAPFDGTSIDALRVGFTKNDFDHRLPDLIEKLKSVKDKGYLLFVQAVNSLNYTDSEFLRLIAVANEIKPYGFGIVDTYGAMYLDDLNRMYNLTDHNLHEDVAIDFHSHNNYQLSFALAQEIIRLSRGTRQLIIDATLKGMGKVAGNLNTELIIDYLVRKLHYDYEFDLILDIIDEYIYEYHKKYGWGYSIPGLLTGVYKAHPNNVIYLTEKFRLDTKDIKYILSMIDPQTRQKYNYDNIERLYIEYAANKTDDREALEQLKSIIDGREVLVAVPGFTLTSHRKQIAGYVKKNKPFVISVNFTVNTDDLKGDMAFFGNQKRYNHREDYEMPLVLTSNVKPEAGATGVVTVNYDSLINRNERYFDNSTMMLFNLLRKLEIRKLSIAGFDGYSTGNELNYKDKSLDNKRNESEYEAINRDVMIMFEKFVKTVSDKCEIHFITPGMFEKALTKKDRKR